MIHILYDGDILLRAMFATKLPPHVAVTTMLKIKDREIREAKRYFKEFNRVDPKFYFCISLNRGFRTVLFPYYKAQRINTYARNWIEFKNECLKILQAFKVNIVSSMVFECDDLISIIASNLVEDSRNNVMIISVDKDFLQIPKLVVKQKKKTGIKYIKTTVDYSMKQLAKQFLLGDRIDNIPGIPKVGTVTADKILENVELKTLYQVYEFIKSVYKEHGLLFYYPSNMVLLRMLTKYNVPLKDLAKVLEFDCLNPEHTINDWNQVPFLKQIFKLINNINQFRTEAYQRKGRLP